MKRYPAYKDSGIQWLGEIPEGWNPIPLKFAVSINPEVLAENTPADYEFEYIDITSVNQNGIIQPLEKTKFGNAPSRARRVVHHGDTIISTVRTYLKAIAFIEENGDNRIASTGFAVLSPTCETNPKFVTYLIKTENFIENVTAESKGVNYPAITPNELGRISVALPQLAEQSAIVAFLDRKLEEIDRYIANKERQIELLEEQKRALINRAVTRGLNPNVAMKPSGIEALGEIPAHWEVRRNKQIFREIIDRSATGRETRLSMSQKLGLVESDRIEQQTLQSESREGFKVCQVNDLVLNRLKAHLGVFARATIPGSVSPDYTVLRVKVNADVRYYESFFRHPAYIGLLNKAVHGVTEGFWRLYTQEFDALPSLFPPAKEQREIVAHIEDKVQGINEVTARTRREIAIIQEYRTALISEAVTGKIDVR